MSVNDKKRYKNVYSFDVKKKKHYIFKFILLRYSTYNMCRMKHVTAIATFY